MSDDYVYAPQCKTCNQKPGIIADIHSMYRAGISFRGISREVFDKFHVRISDDAISSHLNNHYTDSSRASGTILGVVTPPSGFQPGYELDEAGEGTLTTPPQSSEEEITDFSDIMRQMGVDPDSFEVVGTARISKWQAQVRVRNDEGEYGTEMKWMTSYKINIQKKSVSEAQKLSELEELISKISKDAPHKPVRRDSLNPGRTFVFAAGDLQLGKPDGDGLEGITKRYMESLRKAKEKAIKLQDEYDSILISWVGDCIEGNVSQGGRNAGRNEVTVTMQVRILRRLMMETIRTFAPLTNDLQVVSVPGNHDEAQRLPVATDPSDSWAVDALVAVSDALEMAPESYGHVTCHVVPHDEMTITIEVSGSKIGHAHGHQWKRGKHFEWWSGQHWGGHDIGQADILLCGHNHTGQYAQQNFKHFIQVPSFEQESTYFRHMTGMVGNPSAVTFLTANGKVHDIDFE